MARKTFFSFKYEDVSRAMVVRNSRVTKPDRQSAGFFDSAEFEEVKRKGDRAIQNWINGQLDWTSVTVVLIWEKTCSSKWVKYELQKSISRWNWILAVDISKIKDLQWNTSNRCWRMVSSEYPLYLWNNDNGYKNLWKWIEDAAKKAWK